MLTYSNSAGSGNSKVKLPKSEMVKANNTPISRKEVTDFMRYISGAYPNLPKLFIQLSNRPTTRRWGTAFPRQNKIILYRHSVFVFLHELAHFVAPPDKVFCGPRDIHGVKFGQALTNLYKEWKSVMG